MTTAYTSLLGLALPVTGELSGTWGDTVNNGITSLVDSAVAGTTNVSTDADVTLTTTTGAANTAREAILLFSGARTLLRTVTAPAQSKIYTVINATTGGFAVKLVGAGPTTGLTIPNGASAVVAWNGSDFVEIGAGSIGNLVVNGTLTVTGATTLQSTLAVTGNITNTAGTANGVAYLNGSKVVTSGSALTFDGSRLLVGTTTAGVVSGGIRAVHDATEGSPTGVGDEVGWVQRNFNSAQSCALAIVSGTASTSSLYFGDKDSINVGSVVYSNSDNSMRFNASGSEQMRLTSTGLGIGTSSPAVKLALKDTSPQIDFITSAASDISASVYGAVDVGTGGKLVFRTKRNGNTPQDVATLDSSGNLGIGTSSPAFKLDVNGDAGITASESYLYFYSNYSIGNNSRVRMRAVGAGGGSGYGGDFRLSTRASNNSWNTDALVVDSSANVGIGTSSPASKLHVSGASAKLYVDLGGNNYYQASNQIWQNYGGSTEYMRLDSSGNLGIGTSSIGERLVVSGSASVDVYKLRSNTSAPASTDAFIYRPADNTIALGTANTERMRIDSSGNLGLGVTPSAWSGIKAMQIGTAASFSGGSGFNDAFTASNAYYDGTNWKYINSNTAYYASVGGSAAARWYTAPSGTAGNAITFTQAMTLTAAGDLGIGTTSVGHRLHVYGSSMLLESNAANADFLIGDGTVRYYSMRAVSGGGSLQIRNHTANSTIATFDSSGNLGIGTTSIPTVGSTTVLAVGNANGGTHAIVQSGSIVYRTSASTSSVDFYTGNAVPLIFYTSGSERARIDSSGNFLVGTTSFSYNPTQGATISNGSVGAIGIGHASGTADGNGYLNFAYNGTNIGSVTQNSTTSVAYNTSSDYRLKNTIEPMTGALAKVALLKPVTYKWNADGSNGEGFIAHELAEVCPQAVTGEKDAVDAEGNPKYQGIDTSFLVATLTAALQEQQAIINQLKARLDAANL